MRNWPPSGSIALNDNPSSRVPRRNQIVQDDVQPQTRRRTIRSRISQVSRTKVFVREHADVTFCKNLGFSIWRYRIQHSVLVQEVIAGCSIRAAGRRKDKTL